TGPPTRESSFTLQAVNGQLYWIAPIEHNGFFAWKKHGDEGTPGYVKVSATNQEDYALVRKVDGKDVRIKYQTAAYFSEDLSRHIYTTGYGSYLFGEMTFEVDDNWHPYWTVTVFKNKIGFSGTDAVGVMTIDPQTGDIKNYTIAQAPLWIDRIQPADIVSEQIGWWGEYTHGWMNWSGTDQLKVADDHSLVLGQDGRAYFYFGITSKGKENSTVGFVMVDTRTKKVHWFKQAGATEDAAKKSAEGKVQEKQYVGSDGVTYNIDGHPTYEFLLKDKGGLMKLIALVSVHDHTIVGVGENRQEALEDYRAQLTNRGNAVSIATSDMMGLSMEEGCGIYRTPELMQKTVDKLAELKERFKRVKITDTSSVFNTDLLYTIELGYGLDVAECMAHSALNRKESRGAHQRLDEGCTERDDVNFLKHTLAFHNPGGAPRLEYSDVKITKLAPAKRVYGGEATAQDAKDAKDLKDKEQAND
ncbi:MAG: hypothetical protein ACEQSN_12570, partial [Yersinia sp. (in: enterobacteria)]